MEVPKEHVIGFLLDLKKHGVIYAESELKKAIGSEEARKKNTSP
jgi:hypothetical protein